MKSIRLVNLMIFISSVISANTGVKAANKGPKIESLFKKYRSENIDKQNFWHLAPQDLYPGTFYFSCREIRNVTESSFEYIPNTVWGTYVYKITRVSSTPNDIKPPGYRSNIPQNRRMKFSEINEKSKDGKLSLTGTILKIHDNGLKMQVKLPFIGEDVLCRFEIVESRPSEKLELITHRNIPYGHHWRHVIDFYQVKSDKPTPLIIQIHGGGWGALDKSGTMGIENAALPNGISFASINYRYVSRSGEVIPPVKAPLYDAARAVQTLRYLADELNIDKERIACAGGSAGGCSSLWLALHDDLADPQSLDPVARQSTRLWCAGGVDPQTSLDPKQMRQWIPAITYGAHAFGIWEKTKEESFEKMLAKREELLPWINEYSPWALATKDDPPIYCYNPMRKVQPAPGEKGHPTHSPMFGIKLKERLDQLGVEAYVSYKGNKDKKYPTLNDFLIKKLKDK